MTKENSWIVVGKFGRPQGLSGFVRVFSFTEPKDNLYDYMPWHAEIAGSLQLLEPVEFKKNTKFDLVKIAGFEKRELAEQLTNIEIVIEREQLPDLPNDEYYWHQLFGMTVENTQGVVLGTVKDMLATGANDVMIVDGKKRHLIPYVQKEFILNIDNAKNLITVNWDEDF